MRARAEASAFAFEVALPHRRQRDRESGELLGGHIVGTQASVLIQEAAIVMRARASAHVIEHAIYVHPALPEVFQRAVASMAPPASE